MVKCGRCGTKLDPAEADLAADGYRCLSCSMDDAQDARIATDNADIERSNAAIRLRISLVGVPTLIGMAFVTEGHGRWVVIALLAALLLFTIENLRKLLR